jgi:hypothetical protein
LETIVTRTPRNGKDRRCASCRVLSSREFF